MSADRAWVGPKVLREPCPAREAVNVHRSAVQVRKVLPTSPFHRLDSAPPTTDGFSVGGRVTHDRFGMGKIIAVDPEFVTIDFGGGSVKQLRAGARGLDRL